jgi:hypothetical protein
VSSTSLRAFDRREPLMRDGSTTTLDTRAGGAETSETTMSRSALLGIRAFTALSASAQPAVELDLARLDCGSGVNDLRRFSDTLRVQPD